MSKPKNRPGAKENVGSQHIDQAAKLFAEALEHHKAARLDEAQARYLEVLELVPTHAYSWRNLGALQRKKGNIAAAIAYAKRSIELDGSRVDVLGNLANALIDAGRPEEAFSIDLQYQPKPNPQTPQTVAVSEARLRRAAGYAREACRIFERFEASEDTQSSGQLDHAMACLEIGQYRKGFELFEARWQSGQISPPKLPAPKWNLTDDLTGKHLLVFAEQGLGDWIFLSRFLPRLRELGISKLSAVVRPPLVRLMQESGLVDQVYNRDASPKLDKIDTWLSAFDLCRLYLDEGKPMPQPVPFAVPKDSLARGRALTAPFSDRLKVGICWATSPTGSKAAHKSVDVFRFLPLTEVPGTQFFSLYKGKDDDVLVKSGLQAIIKDSARGERDMADTAGLIQNLDLVITVDTGVAHLAATLGVPTWILIPEAAFWYWRDYGEACRFYPSVRLIRQVYKGDWDVPFDRIRMDLERMQR